MKTYYHATSIDNLESILSEGLKANNIEKAVFLCDKPEDAAKFLLVRGVTEFVILPVLLDENSVIESNDHSYAFFKCKAYMYEGDIPLDISTVEHILVPDMNPGPRDYILNLIRRKLK